MKNKILFLLAAAVMLCGAAVASATQTDTLWSRFVWPNEVKDAKFTPSGDSIVVIAGGNGSSDSLYIIETSTGNFLKRTTVPFSSLRFCLFHHSTKMAIHGYLNDAYIWDYDNDTLVSNLMPSNTTTSVDVTPDDSRLILGTFRKISEPLDKYDFKIMIYDLQQRIFSDSINSIYCVNILAISPDEQYFATDNGETNSQDGISYDKLILWRMATLQIEKDFNPIHTVGDITDIKFSPDSKYIGIVKWDGTAKVYRVDSLDLYRNFVVCSQSDSYGPVRVCFSNNSEYLYASMQIWEDPTIKVWNIDDNVLYYTYLVAAMEIDISNQERIVTNSGYYINLLSPH
jgi:WD40 repeat protein